MTGLIDIVGIHKSYGGLKVLRGLDFSVGQGETFAIIGPNGAGKTTLFKVMTGEVPANAGQVLLRGIDVGHWPVHRRVEAGFGRTFQVARSFFEMTALENVVVAVEARYRAQGERRGHWYDWRAARAVLEEARGLLVDLGLVQAAEAQAKLLSHGDKKRLELAVALGGRPSVLMLDEPTAGMSPTDRMATVDLIRRIKAERSVTVVMTEHDMDVIFGLADRLMVMNYGEIIAIGSPEQVRHDKRVRDVYLGHEMYHA